jgi:ribosomal protein L11 methyltransferase
MEYIELEFKVSPQEIGNEILVAELADLGFESFSETDDGLKAYIQAPLYDENAVKGMSILSHDTFRVEFTSKLIADQNWNAKWEENYPPVIIEDKVAIRAPFHPPYPELDFDIIIEPKMSFGTAHHATTAQIISFLLKQNVEGLDILDMGSGTAVLAILASMRGAKHVDAIDNDEWAYNNAVENVARNNIKNISVELGDASLLKGREYDLVIANINRNILLNDIKHYSKCMHKSNLLLLSGFYESDIKILNTEAEKYGLIYVEHTIDRDWVAGIWKMT